MALSKLQRLEFAIGLRDDASVKVAKLRASLSRLNESVTSQVTGIGAGAAGAFGAALSVQQLVAPAIDLNRALGEVASLDVDGTALKSLEAEAKAFAVQYGGTAADVVRASYDIQSAIAGLKGNELAAFTVSSGVLAKATKADVATVTSYMGTMYGIFKQQADNMGRAQWVEQLAGRTALAVQVFKTTGNEMSSAFTAIGANATAAGIRAEEQMAVLGMLQSTMGGSEAGTKYKAFLAGVGNAQKELGLSFTDRGGNMLGMVDILDRIRGKFGDTLEVAESDALKKAFGSDEAVSLIKLLLADTKGLARNIDTLGKVQGMDKARQMAARMTDVWGRLGGAINVVAASFGQVLLPPLEVLGGHIVEVLGTLNRWIGIAPNLFRWIGYLAVASVTFAGVMGLVATVTGIGRLALVGMAGPLKLVAVAFGLLTKVTGLQTAAQWLLNSAILANPITWVVLGVLSLIAVLGDCLGWWDALKASLGDTAWGNALVETVLAVIAPFRAMYNAIAGVMGLFSGSASAPAMPDAAPDAPSVEPPAPVASLEAARTPVVPSAGLMREGGKVLAKGGNSKTTTIGTVNITTDKPMDAALMKEQLELAAG